MIDKGTRKLRNERISRDYPDYSIIKIGQNTEKNLGDLRRLAVTQTPVRKSSNKADLTIRMVYAQPRIRPVKGDTLIFRGF